MPPHGALSDEELLSRAAGGDSGFLAELLDRHRERIWRLLLRLSRSPQEAEDLLQDTFVRVLGSHRSFAGRAKFLTWLYSVALNVFRSGRRRRRRELRLGPVTGPEPEGPEGEAERREAEGRVRQAVANLPENQRTAIILSRYEALSYGEIAQIEDCTVDAVKQRVRRAMKHLRQELRDLQ